MTWFDPNPLRPTDPIRSNTIGPVDETTSALDINEA